MSDAKERARLWRRIDEAKHVIEYAIKSSAEAICKINTLTDELKELDNKEV